MQLDEPRLALGACHARGLLRHYPNRRMDSLVHEQLGLASRESRRLDHRHDFTKELRLLPAASATTADRSPNNCPGTPL